jgi:hypothetical protein
VVPRTIDQTNVGWPFALGLLDEATKTTQQTSISSETDITGLSVTWTAAANRKYKIALTMRMTQQTGSGTVTTRITDSSDNSINAGVHFHVTNYQHTHTFFATVTGVSGSVTYKARASTTSNTVNQEGSATAPAWMIVEDVGLA